MGTLKDFAVLWGVQASFILAVWGIRVAVAHVRKPKPKKAEPPALLPSRGATRQRPFVVLERPVLDYTPSNPEWLERLGRQAAAGQGQDADALVCPVVKEFQAGVLRGSVKLPTELGMPGIKESLYCLEPGTTYLNHGSYGATFKLCMQAQTWFRDQMERQPVKFMETSALSAVLSAVRDVAGFVGADPRDVVPVPNATAATNAVIQSVLQQRLKAGTRGAGSGSSVVTGVSPRADVVIMTSVTYPAVKSTTVRQAALSGHKVVVVQLGAQELSDPQAALAALSATLLRFKGRVRLAVLDHVVSFPPVVLPVQEMVAACKAAHALVLVDGAHAVGSLPGPGLSIPDVGADFHTANLHKWCCTPKGSALLWVRRPLQPLVLPVVTSHGYGLGFHTEFLWQGTADMTAWMAVPAALAVLRALGPGRVAEHNNSMVQAAAALLRGMWGQQLRVLGGDGRGATSGMLALELPQLSGVTYPAQPTDGLRIKAVLRDQHAIEVPVACFPDGSLWVRISAQIYNTRADYERLGAVIVGMMAEAAGQQRA